MLLSHKSLLLLSALTIHSFSFISVSNAQSIDQIRRESEQTVFDAGDAQATIDSVRRGNATFLEDQSKKVASRFTAGKIERPDALIPQGFIIHGILETAINSDLPGNVIGVVSRDVWSLDGYRILIPKGSRLIGQYRSGLSTGQTRVLIAWNRVITGDGISVQLGSTGTDALGRAGMTGDVDNKVLQKYGSAVLLSVLGGIAQYVSTLGAPANQPTVSTTTVDTDGNVVTSTVEGNNDENVARQIAAQRASETINQLANQTLQESAAIPPTIHIDQGERFLVTVNKDLDFSALYPDPVLLEYKRLKNSKNINYK